MNTKEMIKKQQREHVLFMAKAVELLAQHGTKKGGFKDDKRTSKTV